MEDRIPKHISITKENLEKIEDLCNRGNVSKSTIINEVLKEFFKNNKSINVGISL